MFQLNFNFKVKEENSFISIDHLLNYLRVISNFNVLFNKSFLNIFKQIFI